MKKWIVAADLFCGAGGTSAGLFQAADEIGRRVELSAVNHWERAIETHAANHPHVAHFCQNLADLDPKKAVPGGKLDLLVASPECTHHSVARGGKPVNDQSRASAYCIHRWCAALDVKRVLIENVPEFLSWGPLGTNGRPLKSGRGKLFQAFVETLKAMGYRVEWRILNAADYGGATTRRRLFVQCAKGRLRIRWPEPSHEPNPKAGLFETLPKWRAAREIIDWSMTGQSIFTRKRPLSANTIKRIEAGLRKFGGANAEPFLVAMNYLSSREHDGRYTRDVDRPLPTVTSQGNRFGLVEPFLMHTTHQGGDRVSDPANPLPCVTGANRGEQALVEPFVMRASNGGDDNCRVKSPDEPIGTIHAGGGSFGLVEPFILPHRQFQQMDVDSIQDPLRTVTASTGGDNAVVQPFLVPFYANGAADAVADPLRTVTTKDRHALVEPDRVRLDIRFRMLQPHELAAAMGFPRGYKITGNRGEQVKQIGNAVVVENAKALILAMLTEDAA